MNKHPEVAILAAGLGTRMKSSRAKVLHEAGGETLLNSVIRAALHVTTPEKIVAIVGYQADTVKASVRTPGIRFAIQAEQKGTGHALLCARPLLGNEGQLLILNGDGPLLRPPTLQSLVALQDSIQEGGCIVSTIAPDPAGYGRIIREQSGRVAAIVEQKSATAEQLEIREINTGVYSFDSGLFWKHISELQADSNSGEYYLTDMVAILTQHGHAITPFLVEDATELLGINNRVELAAADRILRTRKNQHLMLAGVTIEDPDSVLIDADVCVGADTIIGANVQLRGSTRIGVNCRIGAGSILRDCDLADNVEIRPYVVAEDTKFGAACHIGPFARLRAHASVGSDVHIGNFVELKNTSMATGAKANHLAYLGDSSIGSQTNIGAGTITCNYDGANKFKTQIGEGVFVGSNSTLVAPLSVGPGSYIGAGSVITEDVDTEALALGRARQVNKPGWARKRREQLTKIVPVA